MNTERQNADQENLDNLERLIELTIVHWREHKDTRPFTVICLDILKDFDLCSGDVLRRDHDGISHVDYLIEKMIAEIILENEPYF